MQSPFKRSRALTRDESLRQAGVVAARLSKVAATFALAAFLLIPSLAVEGARSGAVYSSNPIKLDQGDVQLLRVLAERKAVEDGNTLAFLLQVEPGCELNASVKDEGSQKGDIWGMALLEIVIDPDVDLDDLKEDFRDGNLAYGALANTEGTKAKAFSPPAKLVMDSQFAEARLSLIKTDYILGTRRTKFALDVKFECREPGPFYGTWTGQAADGSTVTLNLKQSDTALSGHLGYNFSMLSDGSRVQPGYQGDGKGTLRSENQGQMTFQLTAQGSALELEATVRLSNQNNSLTLFNLFGNGAPIEGSIVLQRAQS